MKRIGILVLAGLMLIAGASALSAQIPRFVGWGCFTCGNFGCELVPNQSWGYGITCYETWIGEILICEIPDYLPCYTIVVEG